MKIIIYTRVSTTEQATKGISLEAQRDRLLAYATALDLEVVAVIEDGGESGKSLDRPGLQEALRLLRTADGLLVAKLDRLTRSVGDWQLLIDRYFSDRGGKQLLSVGDSIDTRSASGRLVLNVLMSCAAWEREANAERTKAALQHKIKNGQRVGKVLYGFDLAADGQTLTGNTSEQHAIGLMRELRAAGHTLRQIAAELSARGFLTKEGNATWSHTAVAYILRRQGQAA